MNNTTERSRKHHKMSKEVWFSKKDGLKILGTSAVEQ